MACPKERQINKHKKLINLADRFRFGLASMDAGVRKGVVINDKN